VISSLRRVSMPSRRARSGRKALKPAPAAVVSGEKRNEPRQKRRSATVPSGCASAPISTPYSVAVCGTQRAMIRRCPYGSANTVPGKRLSRASGTGYTSVAFESGWVRALAECTVPATTRENSWKALTSSVPGTACWLCCGVTSQAGGCPSAPRPHARKAKGRRSFQAK
jgi:hypothetical protein